ncbi:MAG: hypothetical protein LBG06_04050 [Deltaproteobacteria bacterium]|jgi:hypothetical protein|nr:hypothetical protein [Deltaproteobacteria bacterium]
MDTSPDANRGRPAPRKPCRAAGRAAPGPTALALALALAALAPAGRLAAAGNALDLFIDLPPEQAYGLTSQQRKELAQVTGSSAGGYTAPSREGFVLDVREPAVTLFGIHRPPIVYKLFAGQPGRPDVLAVCRSRLTSGPATAYERLPERPPLDLLVYQSGLGRALLPVRLLDYVPPVGVLDFVTRDTLDDLPARRDLAAIDREFAACLTCHASVEDKAALDIVTVTSINAHSCGGFLPQFKLLPLAWNGEYFEKPYDRAASPDEPWDRQPDRGRGLYYAPPGS